jgi:hypothetical protein
MPSLLPLEALKRDPLLLELESSLDDELVWDAEPLVLPVKSTIPTAELGFPSAALLGGVPPEASGLLVL